MDAPSFSATVDNMKNFINFIYMHEPILKQYGAIKIIPPTQFKEVLKKKRVKLIPSSTIQQVTKINQSDFVYSVNMVPNVVEKNPHELLSINETAFWLSLSHITNTQKISDVSILPNTSFFLKRVHQTDFDFYGLPSRSLLRLCDKNLLRQFVPCLIRTHGPGAIFPLASGRQRLFSFNYLHEGGLRYWYIVPARERAALEYVFRQQMASLCFEHEHILIDPLMFDKYGIRYYRLIQHPNEIVILAAGSLSQSFTDNAVWTETTYFALPSWLDDGHANAQLSCVCKLAPTSSLEIIEINSFSPELVQRYINTYLNIRIEPKSLPNKNEHTLTISDASIFRNDSSTALDQSSNQLVTPTISSNLFEDQVNNNNNQQQLLERENVVLEMSTGATSFTTFCELQTSRKSTDDLHQILSSEDFYESMMIEDNETPRCLSFQEIMDLIATPSPIVISTESQTEKQLMEKDDYQRIASINNNNSSVFSIRSQTINVQNANTHETSSANNVKNKNSILCISRMRNDVTKNDIRCHFVGCTKIAIKQSRVSPYLNYAFVSHRTNMEAELNRKRPIDHLLFGSDCLIEYANNQSRFFEEHQISEIWNLTVTQIPENVTEKCLHDLFIGCHSMKYIPARVINKSKTTGTSITKRKILLG